MLSHDQRWKLAINGIRVQIEYLEGAIERAENSDHSDKAIDNVIRQYQTAINELLLALNRMLSLSEDESESSRSGIQTMER